MLEYPKKFPVGALMLAEDKIGKSTPAIITKDHSFLGTENDPAIKQLLNDWLNILMSHRARKMKNETLAKDCISHTIDNSYHFFKR
jgi:hypothetical protein